MYLGVVLPIATYGSVAFWDGKSSYIKNTLQCVQNKVLHLITRAFKTTPISALEIKASIPPINITLHYYTERYATCTNWLSASNPVMCHASPQTTQRSHPHHLTPSPSMLPTT